MPGYFCKPFWDVYKYLCKINYLAIAHTQPQEKPKEKNLASHSLSIYRPNLLGIPSHPPGTVERDFSPHQEQI
jgi:hypothetical protein